MDRCPACSLVLAWQSLPQGCRGCGCGHVPLPCLCGPFLDLTRDEHEHWQREAEDGFVAITHPLLDAPD